MTERPGEDRRRQMKKEGREALKQLDQAEREFLAVIDRARADLDRHEAEGRARFAASRQEAEKQYSSLKDD